MSPAAVESNYYRDYHIITVTIRKFIVIEYRIISAVQLSVVNVTRIGTPQKTRTLNSTGITLLQYSVYRANCKSRDQYLLLVMVATCPAS